MYIMTSARGVAMCGCNDDDDRRAVVTRAGEGVGVIL